VVLVVFWCESGGGSEGVSIICAMQTEGTDASVLLVRIRLVRMSVLVLITR